MYEHDDFESIRQRYKPRQVWVLFIGESPPAGRTFFYRANSNLYRCIHDAFFSVFGDSCGTGENFLQFFQAKKCYLDDLCPVPVNDKPDDEREMLREKGVSPLAEKLVHMQPKAIVAVMKSIRPYVTCALRVAKLDLPLFSVPFPTGSNRNRTECRSRLADNLRSLVNDGLMDR